MTGVLSLAMMLVPAGFAVLLSGDGGGGNPLDAESAAAADEATVRSMTDRSARVTFHLRKGRLGMRILRKAPRETRLVRGRGVRVLCGSTSGLVVRKARWPRGDATLRVELPERTFQAAEFCALKRGKRGIARVVLP